MLPIHETAQLIITKERKSKADEQRKTIKSFNKTTPKHGYLDGLLSQIVETIWPITFKTRSAERLPIVLREGSLGIL